jgi:hypothetical protein
MRWPPLNTLELAMIAEALATTGNPEAEKWARVLGTWQPAEGEAVLARLRFVQKQYAEAAEHVANSLRYYRGTPWPLPDLMHRTVELSLSLTGADHATGPRLLGALDQPYSTGQMQQPRLATRYAIAYTLEGCSARTLQSLRALEPWVPWTRNVLETRADCYAKTNHPLAARAEREWQMYLAAEPEALAPTTTATAPPTIPPT